MANRFLIGTGNRNWNSPSIWSLTSGGSAYVPPTGTEKITNIADRDFSSDTGNWIKGVGHTISGGFLNVNASGGTTSRISCGLVSGRYYRLTYTLTITTGGCIPLFGGNTTLGNGIIRYTSGTYTETNFADGTDLYFRTASTSVYTIDNVSIEEIDNIPPTSVDDVIFDANSGTGTITLDATANCKHFTASNLADAITLSSSANSINIYGSLTLPATNFTWIFTGTAYTYLRATTSETLTMGATSGRSFNSLYFNGVGGTWTLQDELNSATTLIYLYNGTFTTNDKNVTAQRIQTEAGIKTINLGSSTITLISNWGMNNATNLTINCGTSFISTGDNFVGGGKTYYNVLMGNSIIGENTFNNLTTKSFGTFTFQANQTVNNILTFNGTTTVTSRLLIASNTIGTPRTITCNGSIVASNVDFRDITLAGTASGDLSLISGGSGDCGGNSGITFTPAVPQYYKHTGGGTTLWSDATKWFSDTALTVAGRVPLPQDDATFLAGSFDTACTLSVNVPRIGRSLDMSSVAYPITQSLANNIECYGSYVLGENISPSGNFVLNLMGIGNFDLNTYGKTMFQISIICVSGTYTNYSNIILTSGGQALIIQSGTFDLNDYNADLNTFNKQTPAIMYAGNGIISIKIQAVFFNMGTFYSEGSTIVLNPSSIGTNISFITSGLSIFNKIQFSGTHTGNFDITGSNTIAELIIDKGRKVRLTAGTTQTIGKITAEGTVTEPIELGSTTAATATINYTGTEKALVRNVQFTNILSPTQPIYNVDGVDGGGNSNIKYLYALAPKTMGFPIRFVKD